MLFNQADRHRDRSFDYVFWTNRRLLPCRFYTSARPIWRTNSVIGLRYFRFLSIDLEGRLVLFRVNRVFWASRFKYHIFAFNLWAILFLLHGHKLLISIWFCDQCFCTVLAFRYFKVTSLHTRWDLWATWWRFCFKVTLQKHVVFISLRSVCCRIKLAWSFILRIWVLHIFNSTSASWFRAMYLDNYMTFWSKGFFIWTRIR